MICSSRWDNDSASRCPIIACHHSTGAKMGFLEALLGIPIRNVDRDEEEGVRA
jgi:hypothetical protein